MRFAASAAPGIAQQSRNNSRRYPCGETDYCPACHWSRIGDAIFREYKNSYSKAGPWYAITISFVCWGGRLTLVTRKDAKGNTKDCLKK